MVLSLRPRQRHAVIELLNLTKNSNKSSIAASFGAKMPDTKSQRNVRRAIHP